MSKRAHFCLDFKAEESSERDGCLLPVTYAPECSGSEIFLGGHNIAVLVDRSLRTEHERNKAAYLQVNRRLVRNR